MGRLGSATLVSSARHASVDAVEFEFALDAGASGPPPHFHPHQEESWEVLEGVLDLRIAGRRERLRAGESIGINPGTVHSFRNGSGEPVRFRDVHVPALGFQRYIEQLAAILTAGPERDPRTLLRLARLVAAQGEDQRPAGVLSRAGILAGAFTARVLGLGIPEPVQG
jgi:mannose-6-phosphate isomerase-like protein (cupin superfamily)